MLIAAVDPAAEAELDGLNKAVVSGSYLKENAGVKAGRAIAGTGLLRQRHERVRADHRAAATAPSAMPDMNAAWASAQASAPGRTVATVRTTAQQAYSAVLKARAARTGPQQGDPSPALPSPATGPSARWTTSAPRPGR